MEETIQHNPPLPSRGVNDGVSQATPETQQDLVRLSSAEVSDHLSQVISTARTEALLERRRAEMEARLRNRITWTRQWTLYVYWSEKVQGYRAKAEAALAGAGLVHAISKHLGWPADPTVNLVSLVEDEETGATFVPAETRSRLFEADSDLLVSGERLIWKRDHPAFELLFKAMPDRLDFRGYNHSLAAALLPGGFLPDARICLRVLRDHEGRALNSDGSGRIHPDHPWFKLMDRPGGAAAFQIRGLNEKGLLVKGILVPDERCVDEEGNPAIWMDWLQVKGLLKSKAAEFAAADSVVWTQVHLGALQNVWDRRRTISLSFEQLQWCLTSHGTSEWLEAWNAFIAWDPSELLKQARLRGYAGESEDTNVLATFLANAMDYDREDRAVAYIRNKVDEAMARLVAGGTEKLLREVAERDEQIRMLVEIAENLRSRGSSFDPLSIPAIRAAALDKLKKRLYRIAQGAGIKGQQLVAVLDATVEPGTCVVSGKRLGTAVAVWRYPTVLPQGLRILKVVEARDHHLVRGKIVSNAIFMHPTDLTLGMQGDDDGDIVGLSDDPGLVALFENKQASAMLAIEPKGDKKLMGTLTPEGRAYIWGNPMGAVGFYTILQAKLLAVGDKRGAVALAILIQEAVDSAKRAVQWSDWRLATDPRNWSRVEGGAYTFTHRLKDTDPSVLEDGDLPLGVVSKWVKARLQRAGYNQWASKGPVVNVLGWRPDKRMGQKPHRIDPENWGPCEEMDTLVHVAHNHAWETWQEIGFKFPSCADTQALEGLMHEALRTHGIEATIPDWSWDQYVRGLRTSSGIKAYGSKMQDLIAEGRPSAEKTQAIAELNFALWQSLGELTVVELANIWWMEVHHATNAGGDEVGGSAHRGNLNHAFRAVVWPGSPMLQLLGIEEQGGCSALTQDEASAIAQEIIEDDEDLASGMVRFILEDESHGEAVIDADGNPIMLRDCPHCSKLLQDEVVFRLRAKPSEEAAAWAKHLVRVCNGTTRFEHK